MKKTILLSLVLLTLFSQAQDLIFLNSNQSLVNLNPSFAGSNGFVRNQTSLRVPAPKNQSNSYTVGNSFDMYLKAIKGGIAISAIDESYYNNFLRTSLVSFSYAQYLSLCNGNLKIIPSIQATYGRRQTNFDWLVSPNLPNTESQTRLGGGLLVNYKEKLYVGSFVTNRNFWNGFNNSFPLIILHASYTTMINERAMLQFFGYLSEQSAFLMGRLGVNATFSNNVIAGCQYVSFLHSPVFCLGYRRDFFTVLASYDFTSSKLSGGANGYGELHFSYNLRNKENRHPTSLLSFENW